MSSLTPDDRRALRMYLRRFSWQVQDYLGTPLRRIRADLRRDTVAAAADVGMRQALVDLGDPRALAERYTEEHGRRGARGARAAVRALTTLLVVAVSVGAVTGLRVLPRVETAGASYADPAFVPGVVGTDLAYVATDVGPGPAVVALTVRNPGPFSETITGVDGIFTTVRLTPADPRGGLDAATMAREGVAQLSVPPGGVALVRVAIHYPCSPVTAGAYMGTDVADIEVTMLGVTRPATVPLGGTYLVTPTTDWTPPADCTTGAPDATP